MNAGGLLYTSYRDDYHKTYLPVADFLKSHAKPSDLILAGSEFGFAMGFDRNMVDDERITYSSHKKPDFIVVSPNYQGFIEADRRSGLSPTVTLKTCWRKCTRRFIRRMVIRFSRGKRRTEA